MILLSKRCNKESLRLLFHPNKRRPNCSPKYLAWRRNNSKTWSSHSQRNCCQGSRARLRTWVSRWSHSLRKQVQVNKTWLKLRILKRDISLIQMSIMDHKLALLWSKHQLLIRPVNLTNKWVKLMIWCLKTQWWPPRWQISNWLRLKRMIICQANRSNSLLSPNNQ